MNFCFKNIRRIGVFKFRNIGDVLLMTPALRALRTHCPQARITAIVNEATASMLEGNPDIDRILPYCRAIKGKSFFKQYRYEFEFFRAIRSEKFDCTFNFAASDRAAWCGWFSGARIRVAHHNWWGRWSWRNLAYTQLFRYPPEGAHQVEYHLHLLEQMDIVAPDKHLRYQISVESRAWADQQFAALGTSAGVVHVHPVSRWLFKCWDDRRMAAVIDWLQSEKNMRVIVTSGPENAEQARAHAILQYCRSRPVAFIGNITMPQLAALIARATCFVGVDTAPMHLAAAVGTPVVALFGPTSALAWRPWCDQSVVLHKGCGCSSAPTTTCDWKGVRECMLAITVDDVKEAVERFLNK